MIDLNKADRFSSEVQEAISDQYNYHRWDEEKIKRGEQVRVSLTQAVMVIIHNVPPCSDRSVALRKLREARMDCNSAITHDGKY
jgi:hypothetical protein